MPLLEHLPRFDVSPMRPVPPEAADGQSIPSPTSGTAHTKAARSTSPGLQALLLQVLLVALQLLRTEVLGGHLNPSAIGI